MCFLVVTKSQVLLRLGDWLPTVIVEGDAGFLQGKSENKHMNVFPFQVHKPLAGTVREGNKKEIFRASG